MLLWALWCVFCPQVFAHGHAAPEILIINSYHKGYVWSDEVTNGIESAIYHDFPNANVSIEYMDTKRNTSTTYMRKLIALYTDKFANEAYDLIVASDDNAINFMDEHQHIFASNTPVVLCGTQDIVVNDQQPLSNITGVKEYLDVKSTLELAVSLQSNTKKIVVINDKTITGLQAEAIFKDYIDGLENPFDYQLLEDDPLATIEQQISELDNDTVVLLLAYFRDKAGNYYSPEVTASRLSAASNVPIYSVWDFFFDHGILGGQVTSGYRHGEAAGDMAVEILHGVDPQDIQIEAEGGNQMLVDYRQLQRFNLSISDVPKSAVIENISYSSDRNVLTLLSYSNDDPWSNSILSGVRDTFKNEPRDVNIFTEFMDTKRHNDKSYINDLLQLYKNKYKQQVFDAVLVADDNAFQFAQRYRNVLFPGVPIVFSGVNYAINPRQLPQENITGVTESYDILGTVNLGLKLFPNTQKLYVINDQTTSGRANAVRFAAIKDKLPSHLEIIDPELLSMQTLLHQVAQLDDSTLILLMSFTTDKNNHRFSYEDSIHLIHAKASRPILGFWDFYAGEGITAGVITSGYEQGRAASTMALQVLNGQSVSLIPVMTQSPVQPLVDEMQLKRFIDDEVELADNIKILNESFSFYERNRKLVILIAIVIGSLLVMIIAQWLKIHVQHKFNKGLKLKSVTDELTGTKTRRFFDPHLHQALEECLREQFQLCLCYFDLDGLKLVNDQFGHAEGDRYILQVVETIRRNIRAEDELCRVGGDEFAVVLKGCDKQKVHAICKLINTQLQQFRDEQNISYVMNVSCGVSVLDHTKPQSATEIIEKADAAMYIEKRTKN